MHASLHSITHRAPGGATRTRVRWQPYNSLPSSVSSRSPYSNTPLSISPTSTPATSFDSDRLKQYQPPTPSPKDNNSTKHTKYALGLVGKSPFLSLLIPLSLPRSSSKVTMRNMASPRHTLSFSHNFIIQQERSHLSQPFTGATKHATTIASFTLYTPITVINHRTRPQLHVWLENQFSSNQGFCPRGTPTLTHIWMRPPDRIVLSRGHSSKNTRTCTAIGRSPERAGVG